MNKLTLIIIPVLILAAQCALQASFDPHALAVLHSENGPHEIAQFFILLGAVWVAGTAFLRMDRRNDVLMTGWVALAFLCCLYVGGEEVSWGQHFLNWTTPEGWAEINDQAETNFHNTSSWLDQKPRLILMIGIAVGGLVVPLLRRVKPGLLPARFAAFYPPGRLWFIAALAIGVYAVDEILEHGFDLRLFHRTSEIQELYMYYFVLFYLIDLRARLARGK